MTTINICKGCKRKGYWLREKNGFCGLRVPILMTNAETGKPMLVFPEHNFKTMDCCDNNIIKKSEVK